MRLGLAGRRTDTSIPSCKAPGVRTDRAERRRIAMSKRPGGRDEPEALATDRKLSLKHSKRQHRYEIHPCQGMVAHPQRACRSSLACAQDFVQIGYCEEPVSAARASEPAHRNQTISFLHSPQRNPLDEFPLHPQKQQHHRHNGQCCAGQQYAVFLLIGADQ